MRWWSRSRRAGREPAARRTARRLATVSALLGLLAALAVAAPRSATAQEMYLRPADGSYPVEGRGYGHGIGMSQWGAKGAAEKGLIWPAIMAFYYPGTSVINNGNPTIRVQLTGQSSLIARAQSGMRVNLDSGNPASPTQILPVTVVRHGATLTVGAWDIAWYADPLPTNAGWWLRFRPVGGAGFLNYARSPATARLVAFDNPSTGTIALERAGALSTYRGQLRHVRSEAGGSATVTLVAALPMESYLRGVVPSEMPASWSAEAVRSQAVAARTYAEYEREHVLSGRAYDTCDSTACQVWGPIAREHPLADQAIAATAGQILTSAGAAAFTQFSAANGGYTAAGSQPYLVAQPDPYDHDTWTTAVAATAIERAWPSIGRLTVLQVVQRDGRGGWGGRVTQLMITGSGGSVRVTGAAFRAALGLRSTWFKPASTLLSFPSFPRDVTSDRRADVVALSPSSGALYVYPGTGTGRFARRVDAAASGWSQYPLVFTGGTWDTGPVADLMAVTGDGTLQWFRGRGDGTVEPGISLGAGYGAFNLLFAAGDVDGDGGTDLVGRHGDGTLWLVSGNGQGQVLRQERLGQGWASFTSILSPGDLDGDGRPDLLGRTASGDLLLYRGTGGARLRSAVRVGWGWASFTSITSSGDFDADTRSDLIARAADGTLWLYPGNGSGGFSLRVRIGSGWNGLTIVQ